MPAYPPRRHSGQPHRPDRSASRTAEQLPPDYLARGYFREDGQMDVDLLARSQVEPLAKAMGEAGLTSNQLRRFFQHCRAIEARLKRAPGSWRVEQARFMQLDVAAADALAKSPAKIPRLFHDFVRRNVATVKTERDFLEGFLRHFEAIVGFGAQHIRERERS